MPTTNPDLHPWQGDHVAQHLCTRDSSAQGSLSPSASLSSQHPCQGWYRCRICGQQVPRLPELFCQAALTKPDVDLAFQGQLWLSKAQQCCLSLFHCKEIPQHSLCIPAFLSYLSVLELHCKHQLMPVVRQGLPVISLGEESRAQIAMSAAFTHLVTWRRSKQN